MCVCAALPEGKIALFTKVLVISHPCERKKVMIGTVPLIGLCLANFEVLQVPEDPHDRHNHQRGSLEAMPRMISALSPPS